MSRISPFERVSTIDSSPPIVASATIALSGPDIRMDWSVNDNKKVTNLWVLRTTDPVEKTNFDVIINGVALSDTTTSYNWTGGIDGVDYFFWLVAHDAAGNYFKVRTSPNSLTAQLPDRTKALRKPEYTYWDIPGASGTLDITNFTVSFWVKLNAIPSLAARIFSFEGAYPNIALIVSSGTGEMLFNDSGVNSFKLGSFL